MPNALVEAYKLKKELKGNEPAASPKKIQTDDPYQWNPPKRFEHSQAAVLARQKLPQKSEEVAIPTISPVLRKLSSPENFPAAYRKIQDKTVQNVSGDYLSDPTKASSMLKNTSHADLNIKGRSTDFVSEVHWRMNLRN